MTRFITTTVTNARRGIAVTAKKPAIVATTSRKRVKLLRVERAMDDGRKTPPEIKAFFARMIRLGGALPPEKP